MGQAFAPPTVATVVCRSGWCPPGAVPGLERQIGPDSSRTPTAVPTARGVARGMHRPLATSLAGLPQKIGAGATPMKVGARRMGPSERYVFSQCALGVRVGHDAPSRRSRRFRTPVPHGARELLGYRTSAALAHLARRFNATVTSDGRLRLSLDPRLRQRSRMTIGERGRRQSQTPERSPASPER